MSDVLQTIGEELLDKNGNPINPERLLSLQSLKCSVGYYVHSEHEADFDVTYKSSKVQKVCDIKFCTEIDDSGKLVMNIEDMSSTGYGTAVFSKLLDLSERLGVEKLILRASQVGGYFWARLGFLPEPHDFKDVANDIWVEYARNSDDYEDFSCHTHDEFRAATKLPNAKDLFVDTCWFGYLDFSDKAQMEHCNEYLSSKLGRGI